MLQRTVVAFKLDMDQLIGDIIMTSCHYIHCFIMYMSKYFMSSSNDLIRAMTETNTTNNKRNEWIVTSIKFSFNKANCHDLSVESFVIVRQRNGQEQVEGLGIFLNLPIRISLVDCQMVFLANPCCILH